MDTTTPSVGERTWLTVPEAAEELHVPRTRCYALNATDRVKLALDDGLAYPWEIAEKTGLALKTVKNALTGLRKQGGVEPTGELDGRTEQFRLIVPASLPYKGSGRRDDALVHLQDPIAEVDEDGRDDDSGSYSKERLGATAPEG